MKALSKKSVSVGVICIATYLANYYLRNILSVLTPQLLETGEFTVESIGLISSAYMIFYAVGQLTNGFLGDILSPKKMAVAGILVSGCASFLFPFVGAESLHILCFAVFGFGLSMVRGPLMKIISENSKPNHARIICVFFSFSSFAGPLIAGLFAMIGNWRYVFSAAGAVAVVLAFAAYAALTVMEKKQQISYKISKVRGISSVLSVFKLDRFLFFIVISGICAISATSITFWIPTLLTEKLLFPQNIANAIFTVISLIRSFTPFIALIIFRAIKEKDIAMMRVSFSTAAVLFAGLLIAPNRWIVIILLLLGLMAMGCSSALLWSIYIPGLGKTGKVSSVNGVLDCTAYTAASFTNIIFAEIIGNIGWNGVFIIWCTIGVIGVVATLFVNQNKSKAYELDGES